MYSLSFPSLLRCQLFVEVQARENIFLFATTAILFLREMHNSSGVVSSESHNFSIQSESGMTQKEGQEDSDS